MWWPRSGCVFRACETRTRTCMKRSRCAKPGRQGKLEGYGDGPPYQTMFAFGEGLRIHDFSLSKWHCCGAPSRKIPITDFPAESLALWNRMPQMRALLKIASNEFEMRFLVLGRGWCKGHEITRFWGGDFVEFLVWWPLLGWRVEQPFREGGSCLQLLPCPSYSTVPGNPVAVGSLFQIKRLMGPSTNQCKKHLGVLIVSTFSWLPLLPSLFSTIWKSKSVASPGTAWRDTNPVSKKAMPSIWMASNIPTRHGIFVGNSF